MNKNYAIFPCKDVNITQNYNGKYSHWTQSASTNGIKSYPIDICYGDTYLIAPCKMKSVKMNGFWDDAGANVVNQIFFQSVEKVHLANGEYDYITILATHMDDWDYDTSKIGTIYNRGEKMVNQGTDGGVAAHLDIVVGVGKTSWWVQNSYGEWVLPNSRKPEDVFYIDPKYNKIYDTQGIVFKTIPNDAYLTPSTTVTRDEYVDQFEVLYSDVNVRGGAGTNYEIVYYPCTKGIYNVLEVNGDWYKIKDGMWINKIAGTYLPKLELKEEEQPNTLPSEETTEN